MQILGVIGVLALMSPGDCGSKRKGDVAKEDVASAIPIDVTAQKLFADYRANEVSADSTYRGKVLRVSGKVSQISKDVFDVPFVELATSNEFMGVHASFDNEGSLGALKRGQKITVRCRGKGATIGSPMLDGCVLE